jgi:ABC-type amino acid transport system permease subunit
MEFPKSVITDNIRNYIPNFTAAFIYYFHCTILQFASKYTDRNYRYQMLLPY